MEWTVSSWTLIVLITLFWFAGAITGRVTERKRLELGLTEVGSKMMEALRLSNEALHKIVTENASYAKELESWRKMDFVIVPWELEKGELGVAVDLMTETFPKQARLVRTAPIVSDMIKRGYETSRS